MLVVKRKRWNSGAPGDAKLDLLPAAVEAFVADVARRQQIVGADYA